VRGKLRQDVLLLRREPLFAQRIPIFDLHRRHDTAFELDKSILDWVRGQTFEFALEEITLAEAVECREILVVETGKRGGRNIGRDGNRGVVFLESLEALLGFLELLEEIPSGRFLGS
jgi:hypothetical protein